MKHVTLTKPSVVLAAFITMLLPSIATAQTVQQYEQFAQPYTDSFLMSNERWDAPALRLLEQEGRIGDWASPGAAFAERGDVGMHYDTNAQFGRFNDANMWCQDYESDPDGCVINDDSKLIRFRPGTKFGAFTTLRPVTGVTDALNSKVYVDQLAMGLTTPLAVLTSTMNLTEPGITAGLMGSVAFAGNAIQNRMDADNAFYNRLKIHPGDGEFVLSAYENCMARRQAEQRTWIEAQSLCLGGERIDALPAARNFNQVNPQRSLTFLDDPNHPQSPEGRTGRSQYENTNESYSDNAIRALDYMFNQESRSPNGNAAQRAFFKERMDMLRKSFEELIGDIEFRLNPAIAPSGNPDAPGPINGENAGSYSVSIRRIQPILNGVPGGSGVTAYRDIVVQRFNNLQALLYLKCRYFNNNGLPGFEGAGSVSPSSVGSNLLSETPQMTSATSVPRPSSDQRMNFWNDTPGAHQLLIRLSTKGFKLKPRIVDAIFDMFKAENVQTFSTNSNQLLCTNLDTATGGRSNLLQILEAGPGAQRARELAIRANPRIRASFALAQRIGYGQYLATFAEAEDFVNHLTGGAYDSLVKRYMLDLIYDAVGTRNIRELVALNNEQIAQTMNEILAEYVANNVEAAANTLDAMKDAGAGRSMTDSVATR